MKCFFCETETEKGTRDFHNLFACEECFTPWMAKAWNEATERRSKIPEYVKRLKKAFAKFIWKNPKVDKTQLKEKLTYEDIPYVRGPKANPPWRNY